MKFRKQLFLSLSFSLVILLGLPVAAKAAMYYVNGSGSSYTGTRGTYGIGSDTTGNGSLSTPWASLNYAESQVGDGNTIYVAQGTYNENDLSLHCFVALDGITWIADGVATVKPNSAASRVLYINDSTNAASFTGFVFDAQSYNNASAYVNVGIYSVSSGHTFNNCTIQNYVTKGLQRFGANQSTFNNCTFNASSGTTIEGDAGANFQFSGGTITLTGSGSLFVPNGEGFQVDINNVTLNLNTTPDAITLSHSGNFTLRNSAINISAVSNFLVAGNDGVTGALTVSGNVFHVTGAPTNNLFKVSNGTWAVNISNNNIDINAFSAAMYVILIQNQPSPKINDNIIDSTDTSTVYASDIQIVVSSAGSYGTAEVKRNIIKRISDLNMIEIDGTFGQTYSIASIVEDNQLYGPYYFGVVPPTNVAHALFIKYLGDFIVRRNILVGNSGYGLLIKGNNNSGVATLSNGGLYNNIVVDPWWHGIYMKGMANVPIYNNTVVVTGLRTHNHEQPLISINANDPDHDSRSASGAILKNNVVYDNSSDLIRVYADSTSGLTINNNSLYRNAGTNNYGIIGATSYSNWATWLASIYGNSSINTDPLLKNTTGSYSTSTDFQFTDLSPAIDAGTTTSSMTSTTTDYLDNPIYGTPDIGAYEYQPPYTITNDQPQYTGNLRLYADGKYRYTTATTSTATANLSVAPVDGFPTFAASTTRPEYLNIASTTWSTTKSFTASSSYATTTVFTVGDLTPNAYYTLTVDGAVTSNVTCSHCQANGSGIITFTYSGGWSTHTFTLAPDTATPGAFALLSPYQNEATTSLQPLFTWATTTDSGSGLSKYQLYVDDILTVDNIATTSNSTTTAPLSLGTHTWAVWAINNAGNATTSGTSTFSIVAPAVPVTETHRSSGSSVSSQVQNLLAMGNKDAAEALMKQWPNLFPTTPTTESLLAKIAELKALLAAMQGGNEIAAAITPRNDLKLTRSLSLGLTGLDIKQLQQFLNTHGYIVAQSGPGSKGKETTMFGYATKAAVVRFQKANKISPIGVVGPQTRKAIENLSR